jgi:ABC-type lipoprotein export system ATPase subunit
VFGGAPSQFSPRVTIGEDGSTNGQPEIVFSPIPVDNTARSSDSSDEGAVDALAPQQQVLQVPDDAGVDGSVAKSKEPGKAKRVSILNLLPQTQSQIFAYAYAEIEKEKAGFERSSHDIEVGGEYYGAMVVGKMRPPIELSFVDLSLILKGSNKKILSNVTGKLSPGRVTAVMGPSGAGKTTFLNALAGKATHSRTTGAVFINGTTDSIQSYTSIIGFVPQDDIVHGNLTVEENLWFSASYRLPVDMSKRDRVLVVERIIAALGLGPIRDSPVGTVEKRGISGGQRKRVNVGLEMVMDPSLLILDEPTSGLDSTSSRLVLQALRREASMGVNVGVVLHQPRYHICTSHPSTNLAETVTMIITLHTKP